MGEIHQKKTAKYNGKENLNKMMNKDSLKKSKENGDWLANIKGINSPENWDAPEGEKHKKS